MYIAFFHLQRSIRRLVGLRECELPYKRASVYTDAMLARAKTHVFAKCRTAQQFRRDLHVKLLKYGLTKQSTLLLQRYFLAMILNQPVISKTAIHYVQRSPKFQDFLKFSCGNNMMWQPVLFAIHIVGQLFPFIT